MNLHGHHLKIHGSLDSTKTSKRMYKQHEYEIVHWQLHDSLNSSAISYQMFGPLCHSFTNHTWHSDSVIWETEMSRLESLSKGISANKVWANWGKGLCYWPAVSPLKKVEKIATLKLLFSSTALTSDEVNMTSRGGHLDWPTTNQSSLL